MSSVQCASNSDKPTSARGWRLPHGTRRTRSHAMRRQLLKGFPRQTPLGPLHVPNTPSAPGLHQNYSKTPSSLLTAAELCLLGRTSSLLPAKPPSLPSRAFAASERLQAALHQERCRLGRTAWPHKTQSPPGDLLGSAYPGV